MNRVMVDRLWNNKSKPVVEVSDSVVAMPGGKRCSNGSGESRPVHRTGRKVHHRRHHTMKNSSDTTRDRIRSHSPLSRSLTIIEEEESPWLKTSLSRWHSVPMKPPPAFPKNTPRCRDSSNNRERQDTTIPTSNNNAVSRSRPVVGRANKNEERRRCSSPKLPRRQKSIPNLFGGGSSDEDEDEVDP